MKKFLSLLVLACLVSTVSVSVTSCTSAPSERVVEVQTLKAVGIAAKAAIDTASELLVAGKITVPQYENVRNIYDNKFQPAFNLAVKAVRSDLLPASPELISIAAELSALIATYQTH